jgi:dihydrofolate reductase
MALTGIVAIAKNLAIGKDGKLPWHYPADLKFFKKTTSGHIVVMGTNTWRSIGKPLPDRENIVFSRAAGLDLPARVRRVSTVREVVDLAGSTDKDVFIIGGARTYAAFADRIEEWIVTDIPVSVDDADVFMPGGFLDDFYLQETKDLDGGLKVRILRRK